MPSRNILMSKLNLSPEQFADYVVRQGLEDKEDYTEAESARLSQPYQTASAQQNSTPDIGTLQDEAFLTLGEALQKAHQPTMPNGPSSANILTPFAALESLGSDSATLAMQYAVQKYTVEQEVQGLGEEIYRMLVQLAAEQKEKTKPQSSRGIQASVIRGNVDFFHHLETSLREELQLPPAPNLQLTSGG
jgi:hypothetical protein